MEQRLTEAASSSLSEVFELTMERNYTNSGVGQPEAKSKVAVLRTRRMSFIYAVRLLFDGIILRFREQSLVT